MEQFQTSHESWEEAWSVVPSQCLHESYTVAPLSAELLRALDFSSHWPASPRLLSHL